jgi:hypothetical protein
MKKIWNRMGKGLIFVLIIAAVSLFSFGIIKMNRMQVTLNELMSQMFYLQDSATVLQSDVNSMGTNLEAAFKEESSLIEAYSIQVTDCNFAKGTYQVDITVLPKEYTETTQLAIYFGTKSYNLELSGISFKGSATLSMANNYDGNVTVLFTNGEKRSTEVLNSYKDFQTLLKQAASGCVTGVEDSYSDGIWAFSGNVDYDLDGQNSFEFTSFHLIAEVGEETVYDYDLIRETGGAMVQEVPDEALQSDGLTGISDEQTSDESEADLTIRTMDIPPVGAAGDTTAAIGDLAGAAVSDAVEDAPAADGTSEGDPAADGTAEGDPAADGASEDEPAADGTAADETADRPQGDVVVEDEETAAEQDESISGMSGTQAMAFTCWAAETDIVKICLTAVTTDGITLQLTLYEGTLTTNNEIRISDLTTYEPMLDYYDKNDIKY